MSRRASAGRSDGFGTVMVLALAALVIMIAGVLATAGAVAMARHRVEAVADVAALAAAHHAEQGTLPACAAATRLALEHHAVLVSCRLDELDAVVVVALRPPGRAGSFGLVLGRARAGRR